MPRRNTAAYNRLQLVLCCKCNYTSHATKPRAGLCSGVSVDLHIPTHTIQQPHNPTIHHMRHAGDHTIKCSTSTDTRYQRHAGRCTAQHNRPIIIMYIRGQRCAPVMDPCQPGGVSVSTCTGSARRLEVWHRLAVRAHRASLVPSTRRGSPAAGARLAARNHWRLSPQLFSGFRPIANKGKQ